MNHISGLRRQAWSVPETLFRKFRTVNKFPPRAIPFGIRLTFRGIPGQKTSDSWSIPPEQDAGAAHSPSGLNASRLHLKSAFLAACRDTKGSHGALFLLNLPLLPGRAC